MMPPPQTFAPLLPAVRRIGLAVSFFLVHILPVGAQSITGTTPVKIFILAGESNMNGKGRISPDTTRGTLDYIIANDPEGEYQFLKSGGSYVVRDDVGIRNYSTIAGNTPPATPDVGNLTTGYGDNSTFIGPELGFGHVTGDVYENKLLIVKVGVDAATLAGSFCPPSSRTADPEPVLPADKGFYYKEILRLVNQAKTSLGATPYEIAGFGWHQGWNDRVQAAMSAAYETNMTNFINDIRSSDKGLGEPNMPFVIASAGMDGNPGVGYSEVEYAQLKMATRLGNVAVVDTRAPYDGLEFWQLASQSPKDENYHWNQSGKAYLHVGMAMGDALSLLAPGRIPFRPRASGGSGGVTLDWKNGTEIPTSVRVLRNGIEIAAAAPASPPTFLDASAPLGVNHYELQFTMPGSPCPPLTLKHNGGISSLKGHQRSNGVKLTWTNNRFYSGILVKRDGSVVAASLPGTATSYTDFSPPAGSKTYSVEPIEAGSVPAEVVVRVSAAPSGGAVIYEPFDLTAGTTLKDKNGGIGLDGLWNAGSLNEVATGSLSFGTLPTFGNSIARTGSGGNPCSIQIGTTLADAGLLADGAEVWFTFLHQEPNNTNQKTAFILGNEILLSESTISYLGSGIGVRIGNGNSPRPMTFNVGTKSEGTAQGTLATSQTALIVGKITWGANPTAADTIEIYTPGSNLVLDTPTSRTAVLDQSKFNVVSFYGSLEAPKVDEIRFGATYQDVIGQGADTSTDFTPPTPATMSFASPPAATSSTAITMTATAASDANGVQYFFDETSGNPGGTDSGWQDSPTYTDTGLNPNTEYTYTVQARDKSVNNNPNIVSTPASATTLPPDTNPPPAPGFATAPTATSSSAITMTATVVTDPEGGGVQYFFDETSGHPGGTDSGWQTSPTYTDSGLSAITQYTYAVKARDTASPPNESAASAPATATTQTSSGPGAAVIYEPFNQAVGSALNGQAGGTGLGNWTLKASTDDVIKTNSVSYGSLPTSGNQFNGQARYNNNAYPTLNNAGLMNHGATLWFSAVLQPQATSNRQFVLALSTADIDTGAWTVGTTGQCIGFNLQNGQDLEITTASAGTISRNRAADNLSTASPVLVVGQIIWGADAAAADTINLYLPGTSLAKPAILDTSTVVVNQSAFDTLVIGYGGTGATKLDEIRFGASYESVIGQGSSGPGPLDHFAISAISASPQTVGTPITGITVTAQDASNNTVTSFTDTVTFGGTGGFSGTTASFIVGVLSGVSVTPTAAGTNLTLTVTDSVSGKSGSTTITTIQTPYEGWSGGVVFDGDTNNDGVKNGLAFLLGASGPSVAVTLPAVTQTNGDLNLSFSMRNAASRGTATLSVEHSSDLGTTDAWASALVPDSSQFVNGVEFVVTPGSPTNGVTATIPAAGNAAAGRLFGRLKGIP